MSEQRRLSNHPTGIIKKNILTNPSDPRYEEALEELKNRGETPDVVIVPDEVLEKMLTYDGWEEIMPQPGERIPWIKSAAAQVLGHVNPGNSSQWVTKYHIQWHLKCIEGDWFLADAELL